MEEYIKIINDDIKRFIKNYLIGGLLDEVPGMSDIEEYIPSKFPYLSILYLLKKNGQDNFMLKFIAAYECQLQEETDELKKIIGYFIPDKADVEILNVQLSKLIAEKERLVNQITALYSKREESLSMQAKLTSENQALTKMIEALDCEINNLTVQNKEVVYENLRLKGTIASLQTKIAEIEKNSDNQVVQTVVRKSCEEAVSNVGKLKGTFNPYHKSFPSKSEINESKIYNYLIKDCLPYGKYVFEGDIIRNIDLDIFKLNEILTSVYFVGPLAETSINNMTLKRFKEYLIHLLSK